MKKFKIAIIGAGVSGIFAAISKNNIFKTILIDQNEVILKKFMVSGKGKSNITNTAPPDIFIKNLIDSNKFLYPAIQKYNSNDILSILDNLKINYYYKEPTRVHLSDTNISFRKKILNVINNNHNIKLSLNTHVSSIKKENDGFIIKTNNGIFQSEFLIIATGGLSYKILGANDSGYRFAKSFGINVTDLYPIGVGLHTDSFDKKELQGISLDNVIAKVKIENKIVYEESGSLMFTHYGVGGPVIRRVSGYFSKNLIQNKKCKLILVFNNKNDVEYELKNNHWLKDCFKNLSQTFKNVLFKHLGKNIDLKNINKNTRNEIIKLLTNFEIEITKTEPIDFAINTGGGVDLKEIDPNSYETKKIKKLFFIGEVLDLNPRTNGFNITTCFATANKCLEYINKTIKEE